MIKICNLTKSYGKKKAVDDLTLTIPDGAVFGFLGPNGAGKTTAIRMLMGLIRPDFGTAEVCGINVKSSPIAVRKIVGYLPDEIFLYDYLTGYQFLDFVCDIYKIPVSERKDRIERLLKTFDLCAAADDYTVNYSFGMKKKIALASIVIHEPRALILDEPFNGLDPQSTRELRRLLNEMIKKDTTIIFSSHVLEVVEKMVTHVGVISHGRLMAADTLDAVIKEHQSLEQAFFKLTAQ